MTLWLHFHLKTSHINLENVNALKTKMNHWVLTVPSYRYFLELARGSKPRHLAPALRTITY
ncbi:MAG TPA: hypothetical protein V6D25_01575 [Leptolyngbyaceae cyanobacterium]